MTYTLGIDIGTFESKGVLVDHSGNVAAMATAPHEMLVPQPGWAEHRPDDDWWGDFVTITRKLLADTGTDPAEIKAGTLQAWAKDVDYRHLAAAVSNVAGDSPHARKLADRWTASRNEMVGCAGWHTLATIARNDDALREEDDLSSISSTRSSSPSGREDEEGEEQLLQQHGDDDGDDGGGDHQSPMCVNPLNVESGAPQRQINGSRTFFRALVRSSRWNC